jgi:signal transduction histidine kinase
MMTAADAARARPSIGRLILGDPRDRPEHVLRISVVILVVLTVVVVLDPQVHGHLMAPAVDLVLDTMAAVICVSLAILTWVRFRERRDGVALYQASAFLALALAYAIAVAVTITRESSRGSLADPSDGQAWVFAVARVLAAALLVVGGTSITGGAQWGRPLIVMLVPSLLVVVVAVLVREVDGHLDALALLRADPSDGLATVTPLGAVIEVLAAVLFFGAAVVMRRTWRRAHAVIDAWLAVGLAFAGFAQLHAALYPSGHPGQVSTGDLLRLAFFVALLVGLEAEARVTLTSLRAANQELALLREREVDRAAIEERARLARELHDGLAQDLWLAKLRAAELAAVPGLPATAKPLLQQTAAAIDSGLAEARQAVLALRLSADGEERFASLMQRFVEDFEDRFGLRVEFACEGDTSTLAPRVQAEVMRIAQEALTNVRQHASATVVGMRLAVRAGKLSLRVADNGCGFQPHKVGPGSFGLGSMRERAALIGGRLDVRSAPGDGTRIVLTAPVGGRRADVMPAGATA